ncbi:unnamed protein product [Amoebophrya sp. A25]|nr:unnamed protein product [Amoebophrya sp. A25]|eukprot:GSA25T00011859001.1
MNHQQSLQRAIDLGNKASDLDNEAVAADRKEAGSGRWPEVLQAYRVALDNWWFVVKYEQNATLKKQLTERIKQIMERAEAIKNLIEADEGRANAPPPPPTAPPKDGGGATLSKTDKDKAEGGDAEADKLKKSLEGAIVTEKPNVRWSDIAGLEGAKNLLQETVILPVKFPQLFTGKRKPWKGILLYGPPGTGKSHLARAVATEADSTFFSLSSSDLVSKWQGESEKLVKNLFSVARDSTPAVIFIDEIDSMCGSRGDGESESSRRMKTEFLVQMQGVGTDTTGVLMLGATNCPWDLDSAIRRRFEKRIYIPLPDLHARRAMVDIGIGDTPVELTEEDKMLLAERTEGFSGADVGTLCKDALFAVIGKVMKATHFKRAHRDGKAMWTPCSPMDPQGIAMKVMDIASDELMEPVANVQDFLAAAGTTKSSVGADEIARNEAWTAEFGQEGS